MAWTPKFTFSVTWDNITGKPLNYPTTWSLVGGKPSTFPSTWATVSGKPETATRWPNTGEVSGLQSALDGKANVSELGTAATRNTGTSGAVVPLLNGSATWTGNHAFQSRLRITGNSVSWGAGAHADTGIKVDMGTSSAATWLIEGYSGSTRRYGIQGYDPGGRMRIYDGTDFAELTVGVWNVDSIPSLPASKITSGTLSDNRLPSSMSGKTFTTSVTFRNNSNANRQILFENSAGVLAAIRGDSSGGLHMSGEGNDIYLRPMGLGSSTGQLRLTTGGDAVASGSVYASNFLYAHGGRIYGNNSTGGDTYIVNGNTTGDITIRPRGWATAGQTVFRNNGSVDFPGELNVNGMGISANGSGKTLHVETAHGYFRAGPNNATWCHFYTDRSAFYFSTGIAVAGDISFYNGPTLSASGSDVVFSGGVQDSTGDVRKLRFITRNAGTTLAASHLNGVVEKSNNTAYIYTIPTGLGSQGDAITFVNSGTGGNLTISRATNVSLYRNGTNANIVVSPGSMITIYRSATNNRWIA